MYADPCTHEMKLEGQAGGNANWLENWRVLEGWRVPLVGRRPYAGCTCIRRGLV